MDLRSLRYFVSVVDAGGITRAAQELFLSQPALSQAVRQLEDELGAVLLDRGGRRAVPTAAGERLYESARRVLAEAAGARERVRQVAALEVGRLVLVTSTTLSVHPLTPLVASLRREHPGLEVVVRDGRTPAGVLDRLRSGEAEVGVTELPLVEPGWKSRGLGSEEVVLVRGASYRPLPDPLPRAAVPDLDLGQVHPDLDAAGPVAQSLAGMEARARVRCAHRPMLWELVRAGVVVTFVGRRTAEAVLPWASLHSLDPPLRREAGLVWRPGALSPAGEALVRLAGLVGPGLGGERDERAPDR